MSADLFAEFASNLNSGAPQPGHSAQPQSKPTPTNDPFAFLFSPSSQTASPQAFQSSQQWPSIPNQQSASPGFGMLGALGAKGAVLQQPAQDPEDEEEGWGDFEEAPTATPTMTAPVIPRRKSSLLMSTERLKTAPAPAPQPPTRNRIYRADTLDLMSNHLVALGGPKTPEPWQARPSWETATAVKSPGFQAPGLASQLNTPKPAAPKSKPKDTNADVLFDADEFGDVPSDGEDDFGDFETGDVLAQAPSIASVAGQTAMADLLSIDFGPPATQSAPPSSSTPVPTSNRKEPPSQLLSTLSIGTSSLAPTPLYPQAPRSPSFSDRNPFPGLAVTTPISGTFPPELKDDDKEKSPTPVTAWPETQSATEKDDWDAFADFPPDASSATPDQSGVSSSWNWDAVDATKPVSPRPASKTSQRKVSSDEVVGPPPSNIPPPSVLLSVFPELLEEIDARLHKPTTSQTPAVKSRIYADPATLDYLRGFLALSTVAARILAGRKKRWSRDKLLAQGMSISAAGSKGGMKLAGVDKAQATREDREAADVVGVWRDQIGKLRIAVAAANIGIQKQIVKLEPLKIPEINDHMAVTTAKVVLTAPRPCVICGLKREERVKGVDLDVEDSFGEWWVDHWGHKTCRNFWLGNEQKLRTR